ncbi:MAG: secretin and TonB N-terminal domain-containing protein [Candidatus Eremiobacteraeota bacterium]|nr:secretin and TonB N-terminal domain-containing protein [Candidatus Eremiobacteraeota bacterium]
MLLRIGMQSGLSIIVNGNVSGRVSVSLDGVTVDAALTAVLKPLGYKYEHDGNIVVVTGVSAAPTSHVLSPPPTQAPTVLAVTIITADRAASVLHQLYPHAKIEVDHQANALIVAASPENVQSMRTVLQGIDIKNPSSMTVEAVQIHVAKPSDVVAKLRPLYPNARIASGPNKSILIAAAPQDMTQVKAIITAIDAPPVTPTPASASAEAIKVTQARPQDVARAIAHEFPGVRASVAGTSVIVSGTPDDVSKAKALIVLIDQPSVGMRYIQVYRLRFVDAKSVGDLISRSFTNVQVTVDPQLNAISVKATASEQQRIADAINQLDAYPGGAPNPSGGPAVQQPGAVSNAVGPGGTNVEIVSLKAAAPGLNGTASTSATDISTAVSQALLASAPDLRITVPSNSTQLVLTGSPYSIRLARDLINQLDVAQKLVVLDTEILEVDETVAKNLGLQLSPLLATTYTEVLPGIPPTGGTPPPLQGFQTLARTALSFTATLNLLIQRGNARILADPRITTISGRTATIRAGDNISILTTSGGGVGTPTTTQLQTFQTGVSLDITPVINAGNFITVTLHPSVNSLASIINGVPQISTRETQTTVAMQEDQTLVIGGLIEDSISRSQTRLPILGDLPLIGRIFRNETVNRTRNELIITVTPHILYPGGTNTVMPGPPLPAMPTPAALPTLPPGTRLPTPWPSPGGSIPIIPTGPTAPLSPSTNASPVAVPSIAAPTSAAARAFAQSNVFTYGKPPTNTYAGPNDPVQIFYATFSPTVLKNGEPVQIAAITTTNVSTITVSYPGYATQLGQVAAGQWQTTYNFNTTALPLGQNHVNLTLTASALGGQSATIQIPISIAQ